MELSLRKLTPSRVALEIELASETVDQAFRDVYRELAKSAKIPGFRKGKAPREVVARTFGEEDIRQRVWQKLAGQAFMDAVEEAGVIPIDLPSFDYAEPQENQPLTVQATVTVKPEPKLGEYKGIELTKHMGKVEDKDVDEQLERWREGQATYSETDRKEVRKGDVVTADVSILPEGAQEPITRDDTSFLIGEKRHDPPLDEALIGATLGSPVTIETEFGDKHAEEQFAGKTAQATLTAKSIKERKLPELDDDFAQEISDHETIEALRQHVREAFEESARETTERDLRNQAVRAVSDASEVDVPEQLVVEQTKRSMDSMMDDLRQHGLTLEQFLRASEMTTEQLYAQQAAAAREAIKSEIVIDAIAKQEQIEVSDEELQTDIERIAEDRELKDVDVRRELEEHDQIDRLRGRLRMSKTLDFIVERAQIEEVEMPRAEGLTASPNEDAAAREQGTRIIRPGDGTRLEGSVTGE